MDWWQIGAFANGVIALAYLAIAAAILTPLISTRQLRQNRLGVATAAIFLTCAVHHGSHTFHMLLPSLHGEYGHARAMREAFDTWQIAAWDVLTMSVGLYYWSLRRTYGALMKGARLFEDLRERQRQALELNDSLVQGLAVAQLAHELGDREQTREALAETLERAKAMVSELLGDVQSTHGGYARTTPATVAEPKREP